MDGLPPTTPAARQRLGKALRNVEMGGFAEGLELASALAERLCIHDPAVLRRTARMTEARAESSLERGVAAGFVLLADDIEDREEVPPIAL